MKPMIGVIGGSGVYNMDAIKVIKEHIVETPFGDTTSKIIEAQIENTTFFFLARHGKGHYFNPSEVNYRANIFALKKMGVQYIISVSAVGSLKEEYAPGTFVLVDGRKVYGKDLFLNRGWQDMCRWLIQSKKVYSN